MTYKIALPLKTRQVEPWADYVFSNHVFDKPQPVLGAIVIRKAIEFNWFDGDKPADVDEMLPKDVVELSTQIIEAFSHAMGFDEKNSQGKPPTSQKK